MQITINLTPILVVLIICIFLYAMCKMARQGKENEQKFEDVIEFKGNTLQSKKEQRIKEYVEDQVKKGENKK